VSAESTDLTIEASFATRFFAWVRERFPLVNGVLFLVLFVCAVLVGRAIGGDASGGGASGGGASGGGAGALRLTARDLLGFAGVWAFFLLLRVFDEHKDYDLDCRNHPGRVLQRGLITLTHLKIAGAIAVTIQIVASVAYDRGFGSVTAWWGVTLGWSLLMAREFFARAWLARRLVIYAVSHMLVMPLALLWMVQMGAGRVRLPVDIGWLCGLSFLSGFAFELARKIKAPDDEREGVDSYTKVLGTTGAPIATIAVLCGGVAMSAALLRVVVGGVPLVAFLALVAGTLLPASVLIGFARKPSARLARLGEASVSLAMLIGYVVVIVTIAASRGLEVAW
jgi:4-hydroxybenzoate polyprenyltransferase